MNILNHKMANLLVFSLTFLSTPLTVWGKSSKGKSKGDNLFLFMLAEVVLLFICLTIYIPHLINYCMYVGKEFCNFCGMEIKKETMLDY